MTAAEYRCIGFELPECRIKTWPIPGAGVMVELRAAGSRLRVLVELLPTPFTDADILHKLLHVEANYATMPVRDFLADWPDQSYRGRLAAIKELVRLRRQRRILKRMFPEECP